MKTYHYDNYHLEKQPTGEWVLFDLQLNALASGKTKTSMVAFMERHSLEQEVKNFVPSYLVVRKQYFPLLYDLLPDNHS